MSHQLTYDTLPPHSKLRREYVAGVMKITAAPEEPGPAVRRAAMIRAAVPAAMICCVTLIVGLAALGATYQAHRARMSVAISVALLVAFVLFCLALFAFCWRIQYASRIDAAAGALRQSTVLAVSSGRLIIETSGPFGSASYDLKNIDATPSVLGFRRGRCETARQQVDCLQILLADGTTIHVLPGRDAAELNWVARTLRGAISQRPAEA